MKKSIELVKNIGDILTGNYDPDFVMTLIELMDPVTLSIASGTNRFLANYSVDEKIWEKHVKRDISDSPKLRHIYDAKLQNYRAETYKEMYERVGKLILQIILYQRSLNHPHNPSEIKSIPGNKLSHLFSLIIDHGFDKFNHHFPALFSLVDMNTILDLHKPCNTFLHIAASRGHTHLLQYLLAHGAKVNALDAGLFQGHGQSWWLHGWRPHSGQTPLVYAASIGAIDCVAALIAARANINFQSPSSGTTALHKAAAEGHAECIKKLLAAGANTHISNKEGSQALEVAKDSLCRALLEEKMRQRGELTQSSHCLMM